MHTLQIVTHTWQNRGVHTSVERMCSLLRRYYAVSTSDAVDIPQRLATRLKRFTNSRPYGDLSAPYNTHYMKYEFGGIGRALHHQPDILFFPYADYDYYFTSLLKPVLRPRHVLYSYFSVEELTHRFANLHHFERADCVFAAGREQTSFLRTRLAGVRVEYLPLGVDTEFFTPAEESQDLVVLQSGINRRDIPLALHVLDRLHMAHPQMSAEFIGCSSIAHLLGDRSYVTVHGYLDDIQLRAVYRRAAFQILPLVDGGSSNSLNEGYACGLPVVVTDLDNIRDYVDADASILVPPGDSEMFFEACMWLCEDDDMRIRMGRAARLRAESLSWGHVVTQFNDVVREVLGN